MRAETSTHMSLNSVTETVSNAASSAAIIIGGVWAYFKFIRGRVFARRAELSLSLKLEERTESVYLWVTITLKNNGISKLPINENMKVVRVFGLVPDANTQPSIAGWGKNRNLPYPNSARMA